MVIMPQGSYIDNYAQSPFSYPLQRTWQEANDEKKGLMKGGHLLNTNPFKKSKSCRNHPVRFFNLNQSNITMQKG
jgi:hypothetical protein